MKLRGRFDVARVGAEGRIPGAETRNLAQRHGDAAGSEVASFETTSQGVANSVPLPFRVHRSPPIAIAALFCLLVATVQDPTPPKPQVEESDGEQGGHGADRV